MIALLLRRARTVIFGWLCLIFQFIHRPRSVIGKVSNAPSATASSGPVPARLAKTAAETIATSTDEAKAREALKQATKVLYKAISSGTLHRNTVRRKVARLSASLHRKFSKKA